MKKLENFFDLGTLQRGLDLFQEGSVIEFEYDSDINLLVAQVQGTRSRPYEVEIYIDDHGDPDEAFCTCPVEFDCKHAVAALLAYQQIEADSSQQHFAHPGGTPDQFSQGNGSDALAETWWHRWSASLDDRPVPTIYTASAGPCARSRIYSLPYRAPTH